MRNVFLVLAMCFCASAGAQLNAGVATVSITPLEANIPTQLGGYGAREGKPAEGVHDTLYGKVLILERDGRKTALVTLDVCGVPLCVTEESLAKAGIENLTVDQVLMTASHTHTGLEGASLDRRNVANNPYVGIFSEPVLNFVTDRLAQGLRDANKALQPVRAGAGLCCARKSFNLSGVSSLILRRLPFVMHTVSPAFGRTGRSQSRMADQS